MALVFLGILATSSAKTETSLHEWLNSTVAVDPSGASLSSALTRNSTNLSIISSSLAIPSGFHLDTNCLQTATNRVLARADPLPCPCCVPDGTRPLEFTTISRPDRVPPTLTETSGWSYTQHERATVTGFPNPTESSLPASDRCARRRDFILRPDDAAPGAIERRQESESSAAAVPSPSASSSDWALIQSQIFENGAVYGENYPSGDHYWADHSVFHRFENSSVVSGIAPLWGCVGVVVASNRGVWMARLWEAPTFSGPTEEDTEADEEGLYQSMGDIYIRRVQGLLLNGTESVSTADRPAPGLRNLVKDYFPDLSNLTVPGDKTWRAVILVIPQNLTATSDSQANSVVSWLKRDLSLILEYPETAIYNATYETSSDQISQTDDYFSENPGENLLYISYQPGTAEDSLIDGGTLYSLEIWWDRAMTFRRTWCKDGVCECGCRPSDLNSPVDTSDGSDLDEVDYCPEENPKAAQSLSRRQNDSDEDTDSSEDGDGDEDEDAITILQEQLTHPLTWPHGGDTFDARENDWWVRANAVARTYGAGNGDGIRRVDEYAINDATFQPFGPDHGVGSGVIPLFGCTVPDFDYSGRPTDTMDYSWDAIFTRRIERLFRRGFRPLPDGGHRHTRALQPLVEQPGAPFHPANRAFLKVALMTPDQQATRSSGVPRYRDRVARIRDLMAHILYMNGDYIDVSTYPIDPAAETIGLTTRQAMAYFEGRPGLNQFVLQYAPKHPSVPVASGGDTAFPDPTHRAFCLWFSKQVYWEHHWRQPQIAAVAAAAASLQRRQDEKDDEEEDVRGIEAPWEENEDGLLCPVSFGNNTSEADHDDANGKQGEPHPAGEDRVCHMTFRPMVYLNRDNQTKFPVQFSLDLWTFLLPSSAKNGKDLTEAEENGKNSIYRIRNLAGLTMGDGLLLAKTETGLDHDLYIHVFEHSWAEYLQSEGFACRWWESPYYTISEDECPHNWLCNCNDPDSNSAMCWPKQDVTLDRCCLTRDGCGNVQAPTTSEDDGGFDPALPFSHGDFDIKFRYRQGWSIQNSMNNANAFAGSLPFTQRLLGEEGTFVSNSREWQDKDDGYVMLEDEDLHWDNVLGTYFRC